MAKVTKKLARNLGKGIDPSIGTGPLAGPDYNKLFTEVADQPAPLGPLDSAELTTNKRKKMKKSIFNS